MQPEREKDKESSAEGAAKPKVSFLAGVELAVTLMVLMALTVLLGAWCPQESQVGKEKVFEAFSPDLANFLIKYGVSDIFHSPWFLFLVGMLTVNMVAVSFQRVFPKVRLLKHQMPFLRGKDILKLPYARRIQIDSSASSAAVLSHVVNEFAKRRFEVKVKDQAITAESGRFGRLAATVTHIGLLTLLLGVTITSWTGFSGFHPVRLDSTMSMAASEHSKLWIGKLPAWGVRVDATRRENYPTGEAKQWYTDLSIIDANKKVLKKGQISVNNPLSFDGVDIYQSSWGLDVIDLKFNGHEQRLPLEPMGKRYAAFLPLDRSTVLIFSVLDQTSPLRVFAKRPEWQAPKLITEVNPLGTSRLGSVELKYERVIPVSGLQYKCDPGIPIIYTAFAFIMAGVLLAAIPHRHVWASLAPEFEGDENQLRNSPSLVLYIGGRSVKAKVGFEKLMDRLTESLIQFQQRPEPKEEPVATPQLARAGATGDSSH